MNIEKRYPPCKKLFDLKLDTKKLKFSIKISAFRALKSKS